MPPVFGPVSPSPTALWSWAEAKGSAVSPSTRAVALTRTDPTDVYLDPGPPPLLGSATDAAYKLGLDQKANEQKAKDELISKGMIFNTVDTTPFVQAVQPVIAKYAKGDVKKFYDAIMGIK